MRAADGESAVCCWALVFFYGEVFSAYVTGGGILAEQGDLSEIVVVATLLVGVRVVVVAEFV